MRVKGNDIECVGRRVRRVGYKWRIRATVTRGATVLAKEMARLRSVTLFPLLTIIQNPTNKHLIIDSFSRNSTSHPGGVIGVE